MNRKVDNGGDSSPKPKTSGFSRRFFINYTALKEIIRNATPPELLDNSYQPTCVFLLLFDKEETNILAIQKADNEGYPWRNQVALPGGHVDESDRDSVEAVFRELREELNITKEQVDFIGSLGHFPTISHKDIEVFTGIWNGEGMVRYDSHEISRVLEVPLKGLLQTHHTRNFHGRVPDIYELVYPLEDVAIWGATARMLHYFIELLFESEEAVLGSSLSHYVGASLSLEPTHYALSSLK